MAYKTQPEKEAEKFIERIKSMVAAKDGLIYEIYEDVSDPNGISFNTLGDKDAIVEVTFYNVMNIDDVFDRHEWMRLGEMDADVDTHRHAHEPSIEIYKRFKG